jgi:Methyltransferase domain
MTTAILERVLCDLCGSDEPRIVKTENGLAICKCAACGLHYVNPRPRRGKDEDAHWFTDHEQSSPIKEAYEEVYHWGLDWLASSCPSGGRLLDVGCGWGFFVEMAAERGWDAHGLDVSPLTTTFAREKLGLTRIRTEELRHGLYPENSFHAATLWNLLEHLTHPAEYLRIVRSLLRPGGVIAVRVPNMDFYDVVCRLAPLFSVLGHHDVPYLAAPPPGHLYGFNQRTLRQILSRTGYEVLGVSPSPLSRKYSGPLRTLTQALHGGLYAATFGRCNLSPAIIAWARKPS